MKEQILACLPPDHPWRDRIHWFPCVDSTNNLAKQMAAEGAPHGTVIIAEHQSAGRGRLGRSFSSANGMGVYLSILLRPECKADQLMHLTCATAVSMCDAIEYAIGIRPGIKWTNDLVYEKRKLGGILTELSVIPGSSSVDYVVIGIGINCQQKLSDFPQEIQSFAGSLSMITGEETIRHLVAAQMILHLHKMAQCLLESQLHMIEQYRRDCITIGKEVSVVRGDAASHGTAISVTDNCSLIVKYPDGREEIIQAGEVSIRGMYGYV